ncbi:MAG TPA: sulfatase [Blastocatellia bacterium]|nr:sulfatase [Blastocatellia bacterium]
MSIPGRQAVPPDTELKEKPSRDIEPTPQSKPTGLSSLARYALAGGSAAFLLGLLEWIDVNIRLTPFFESVSERAVFSTYFCLPLITGSLLGIVSGAFFLSASYLSGAIENIIGKRLKPLYLIRPASWIIVASASAILLYQQPKVYAYARGLVREMEKFSSVRVFLLNHERATTLIILFSLFLSCWVISLLASRAFAMNRMIRTIWMAALAAIIAAAYYADSRLEIGLYENSFHHSMFLLNFTLAMAFSATLFQVSPRIRSAVAALRSKRLLLSLVAAVVAAAVLFTFWNIDRNQNLKTQLFHRTTQAKQHFKLVQWAVDFDRDGYSALLGGGDSNDRRSDINPGQKETVGDGLDNNGIGGDLTQQDIDDWRRGRSSLNKAVPAARRLNVIYIFIDALRADHLGTYGYPRNTSPNIDKLAARSVVFERAYSPAPNTFEAFPKFMQSSHWDGHYETWTEALARNGYNNLLFPRRIATQLRYVKGMRVVHEPRGKRLAETIDVAIRLLGSEPADKPFCAFLYATDPHRPYLKHDEFDFGPGMIDRYDGEIAFADHQFGRLFDWMEGAGLFENTMVVIMADHGESLGERGIYKHSSQLYDEQIRVPMIIYVPGIPPRRVPDFVSTVDLGATILSAVGIQPPDDYAGVSLLPLMKGEPFTHPPIYAEQTTTQDSPYVRREQNLHPHSKKYMVITQDGYKLIYNRNAHTFELFDLKADPREERNIFDREAERAGRMKMLLGRFIDIVLASRPEDADESQYFIPGSKETEEL